MTSQPEFQSHVTSRQPSFQRRVQDWMMECFSMEVCRDTAERNHRFLEEALELIQSRGCTASEAHQLVDYVFGRPAGEPTQEVGGVMVTLAALCLANGFDMHAAGEIELARIWTHIDQIRAKQAAKPKHSPLPVALPVWGAIKTDQGETVDGILGMLDRYTDSIQGKNGLVCGILMANYAMLEAAKIIRLLRSHPQDPASGEVLAKYEDLPPAVAEHLSTLEDLICDLDGKTLALSTGEDTFSDEGTIVADDYVAAFNGIAAWCRAALFPSLPASERIDADVAMQKIWADWFTFYEKHFRGPGIAISMADQAAFYEIAQPILRALAGKSSRAFELGALAMRQLAEAKCGNLTESLQEDAMTSAGLTAADKKAMNHQVNAINEVRGDIARETPSKAAYYGSYILSDAERIEIKALFPDISETRGRAARAAVEPPTPVTDEAAADFTARRCERLQGGAE